MKFNFTVPIFFADTEINQSLNLFHHDFGDVLTFPYRSLRFKVCTIHIKFATGTFYRHIHGVHIFYIWSISINHSRSVCQLYFFRFCHPAFIGECTLDIVICGAVVFIYIAHAVLGKKQSHGHFFRPYIRFYLNTAIVCIQSQFIGFQSRNIRFRVNICSTANKRLFIIVASHQCTGEQKHQCRISESIRKPVHLIPPNFVDNQI